VNVNGELREWSSRSARGKLEVRLRHTHDRELGRFVATTVRPPSLRSNSVIADFALRKAGNRVKPVSMDLALTRNNYIQA
jgi:hypothetical protein